MGEGAGRTCNLRGLGAVPMVWSRAEGELRWKSWSGAREEDPKTGYGMHRAFGKREFTRNSHIVTGMTQTGAEEKGEDLGRGMKPPGKQQVPEMH